MINPKNALRFNSLIVVIIGLISYFNSSSPTALIPVGFGVILFILFMLYDKSNKLIAHIALLFIVLLLAGLYMALMGAIERTDSFAILRVSLMMVTTSYALVCFIKSFIDARRK
tara:strand:+ start:86 stop:427 length:342 start_codon:yes stop_codon:yes gene_type:complete